MENDYWTRDDVCHWCGKTYKRPCSDKRHRFCSKVCKQAHYRAYKKYVTVRNRYQQDPPAPPVTQKKTIICPLCNKKARRIKDNITHKLYIHKESFQGKGGRSCIVPTPKKRKKRK